MFPFFFCLKPQQIKCFEHLLNRFAIGFGKSLLFQLLPNFLQTKSDKNIVIVVCLLNAIIEDQLEVAKNIGVKAEALQLLDHCNKVTESLFGSQERTEESDDVRILNGQLVNGDVQLVFHPEALRLSKEEISLKAQCFKGMTLHVLLMKCIA